MTKEEILANLTNLEKAEFIARRRSGIGGSDIAAVIAVSMLLLTGCLPIKQESYQDWASRELETIEYNGLEKHCALCALRHPECEGCKLCETRKVLNKARGKR